MPSPALPYCWKHCVGVMKCLAARLIAATIAAARVAAARAVLEEAAIEALVPVEQL